MRKLFVGQADLDLIRKDVSVTCPLVAKRFYSMLTMPAVIMYNINCHTDIHHFINESGLYRDN